MQYSTESLISVTQKFIHYLFNADAFFRFSKILFQPDLTTYTIRGTVNGQTSFT